MSDKQAHGPILNIHKNTKVEIDTHQTDVDAEDEGQVVPEEVCSAPPIDEVADEHVLIKSKPTKKAC